MNLIEQVASDHVLNQAYAWLCHSRRQQHHNRDVWWLRFHLVDLKVAKTRITTPKELQPLAGG
jgi:hypothetical protein